MNPSMVTVIPYPVKNIGSVEESEVHAFRRAIGLDSDGILIFCFGDTRYDKGVDLAIGAMERLDSRFKLLIAGRPASFEERDLRSLAEQAGVSERVVIMARFLSNEESAIAFGSADVILLPYRKGFSGQSGPLVVGAALGKPVVASSVGVLRETVERYKIGVVFEAENIAAMATALETAAAWRTASSDTAWFQDDHSASRFVERLCETYRGIARC